MSLPCLDALMQTGIPIMVCARPWARSLLRATPIAGFIDMNGSWLTDTRQARRNRLHHASKEVVGLVLPDSFSSALVFRLAGIPSFGYRDDGRSPMLTWSRKKPEQAMHAVESWFNLTQQALQAWQLVDHISTPPDHLSLTLDPEHEQQADAVLRQADIQNTGFVLIAPTAIGYHKGKNKVWPHFDELTQALQRQGHTVLMCPPPAEREQALANAPHAICLPPLELGAFAALTRRAGIVVCNDSGVSHIAAAAGAAQMTLFGVTDSRRTGPWSPTAICLGQDGHWPDLSEVLQALQPLLQPISLQGSA